MCRFVTASMDQEVRLWDSESMRVVDKYKNEAAILDIHWVCLSFRTFNLKLFRECRKCEVLLR